MTKNSASVCSLYPNPERTKDTEHKPLGRLFLEVTHGPMSSAVQTLTQVKAQIGIIIVQCRAAAEVTVPSVNWSSLEWSISHICGTHVFC
jgi:hypothetical protein